MLQTYTNNSIDLRLLRLYAGLIRPGDLCFDIGANVGARVYALRKLGVYVVAVEPQSKCVRRLNEHLGTDECVRIVRKAVGEAECQRHIFISEMNTVSTLSEEWITRSQSIRDFTWPEREKVDVTTLDKLIEGFGRPTFIKIDTEGYERFVLRGLTQPVKALSFEFSAIALDWCAECLDHLRSLGQISLNMTHREGLTLVLPQWVNYREMLNILSGFDGTDMYGDIFVKFIDQS